MGLIFTGLTAPLPEGGTSVQAKDAATGSPVPVRVSDEAIQDYGLDAAKRVADRKHSAGQLEDGGVWVRTTDF